MLKFFKLIMKSEDGFWIPLAMMAGGMLKNQFVDKPAQKRQNMAQAAQTEFSPLTGSGPGQIQSNPSTLGAGLKWGSTGLALNQAVNAAGGLGGGAEAAGGDTPSMTSQGTAGVNTLPQGAPMAYNQLPTGQQNPWQQMQQQPGLYNA